jgi:protein-S-isoprenylcysteine O-methyltransferase Ste14
MTDLTAIYRDKSPSAESKLVLACAHLLIVMSVAWLLFGGGISAVEGVFGAVNRLAPELRRGALVAAATLYFLRTLVTLFVFMKRRMPWSEVATIAIWVGTIDLLFAYFGGRNETGFGTVGLVGAVLVVGGSTLNTGSELQRHLWKRHPENAGHLYTRGLFALARHINYFGDVVLFTGWVLMTGRPWLLVIPAMMVGGFVFANIPALDRYLEERYGDEYRRYARHVKRLVPYVY